MDILKYSDIKNSTQTSTGRNNRPNLKKLKNSSNKWQNSNPNRRERILIYFNSR